MLFAVVGVSCDGVSANGRCDVVIEAVEVCGVVEVCRVANIARVPTLLVVKLSVEVQIVDNC